VVNETLYSYTALLAQLRTDLAATQERESALLAAIAGVEALIRTSSEANVGIPD
jgi:hypothetical protein